MPSNITIIIINFKAQFTLYFYNPILINKLMKKVGSQYPNIKKQKMPSFVQKNE